MKMVSFKMLRHRKWFLRTLSQRDKAIENVEIFVGIMKYAWKSHWMNVSRVSCFWNQSQSLAIPITWCEVWIIIMNRMIPNYLYLIRCFWHVTLSKPFRMATLQWPSFVVYVIRHSNLKFFPPVIIWFHLNFSLGKVVAFSSYQTKIMSYLPWKENEHEVNFVQPDLKWLTSISLRSDGKFIMHNNGYSRNNRNNEYIFVQYEIWVSVEFTIRQKGYEKLVRKWTRAEIWWQKQAKVMTNAVKCENLLFISM